MPKSSLLLKKILFVQLSFHKSLKKGIGKRNVLRHPLGIGHGGSCRIAESADRIAFRDYSTPFGSGQIF